MLLPDTLWEGRKRLERRAHLTGPCKVLSFISLITALPILLLPVLIYSKFGSPLGLCHYSTFHLGCSLLWLFSLTLSYLIFASKLWKFSGFLIALLPVSVLFSLVPLVHVYCCNSRKVGKWMYTVCHLELETWTFKKRSIRELLSSMKLRLFLGV